MLWLLCQSFHKVYSVRCLLFSIFCMGRWSLLQVVLLSYIICGLFFWFVIVPFLSIIFFQLNDALSSFFTYIFPRLLCICRIYSSSSNSFIVMSSLFLIFMPVRSSKGVKIVLLEIVLLINSLHAFYEFKPLWRVLDG